MPEFRSQLKPVRPAWNPAASAPGALLLPPRRPSPPASPNASSPAGLPFPGQPPATYSVASSVPELARELAHDARNFLSALDLYCELLASPGVLAPGFGHYAQDLRVVGRAGARLLAALAGAPPSAPAAAEFARPPEGPSMSGREALPRSPVRAANTAGQSTGLALEDALGLPRRPFPPIDDLAAELAALEAPLRALAGPRVRFEIEAASCAGQIGLNAEELFRVLFNLVANAVEAMAGPRASPTRVPFLRITAQRGGGASFLPSGGDSLDTVVLSVRDNGPGIAAADRERVFAPGFSTRAEAGPPPEAAGGDTAREHTDRLALDAQVPHGQVFDGQTRDGLGPDVLVSLARRPRPSRGLGLAIVKRLVEDAGGAVRAVSRPGLGARFDIELPILAAAAPGRDRRLRSGTAQPQALPSSSLRRGGNEHGGRVPKKN